MHSEIPKIFHQIWLGGEMPDAHKYFRDHLLELHPNWQYMFWNEENLPKLKNQEFLNQNMQLMFKSDIIRYEMLEKYGGIYVDTDYLVLKNLDELLNRDYIIVRDHDADWDLCLSNAFIGFIPNQNLIKYVVNMIPVSMQKINLLTKPARSDYLSMIGPGLIRKAVLEIMPNAFIWPKKYFSPISKSSKMHEEQFMHFGEAYAMHLWNYNNGSHKIEIHKNLPCYIRKQH